MAGGAIHRRRSLLELSGMNVFVASHTPLRRRLETNLPLLHIRTRRPVTIQAAQHAVAPQQRECRGPMVERLQLAPRAHFVARFADALAGVQPRLRRGRKLPVVRILMAAFAIPVREMISPVRAM